MRSLLRVRGWLRSVVEAVDAVDQRIFDHQARSSTPVADIVLPRLTRAADRSVLWLAVAAVMALTGGARGRMAGTRGLLSIGLASLLANQLGKRLLPRRRPVGDRVPVLRRARRRPSSTSFPSGHSASAAAFALGVSTELPELAVPLGLTAAAVCWSRVYTGVHYPSDVLAGAALGAACAAMLGGPPGRDNVPYVSRTCRATVRE